MKIGLSVLILLTLLVSTHPAAAQAAAQGQIAIIGRDGNLYLIPPDGSARAALTSDARNQTGAENTLAGRRYYSSPAWSPDGTRLLFYRNDEIYSTAENRLLIERALLLYDHAARSTREITTDAPIFVWKADGTGIFYPEPYDYTQGAWDRDRGIWSLDLSDGQAERVLAPQNNLPLLAPGVSPDGRYLTFEEAIGMEGRGHFGLHDFQLGTTHVWNDPADDLVGALQWTPDSALLVFDRNGYVPIPGLRIWKADPAFQQVTAVSPEIPGAWFYGPSLSPAGDRLVAYAGKEADEAAYLWIMNLDGSGARELLKTDMGPYTISWSPLGDQLVVTTGQYLAEIVQVIDLAAGQVTQIAEGSAAAWNPVPPQPPALPTGPAVSPTAAAAGASAAPVSPSAVPSPEATLPAAEAPVETPTQAPAARGLPNLGVLEMLIALLSLGGVVVLGVGIFLFTRSRKP